MDIQTLKTFCIVAEIGSFSGAAQRLNYAQSNISTKIHQLESELQTTLFYRHNRGITLTPKGQLLMKYSTKIFHLLDETMNAMKEDGIARGPIMLGSMETIASAHLPKLLATYHQNYPQVDLSLFTGTTAQNIEKILNHTLDGAFVAGPVNHPDLCQKPFVMEKLVFVTAMMHPTINSWKDIKNRTLLVFPYGCSYRNSLEQLLHQENLLPDKIIEFNSLDAIISSICAGLGISLLPSSTVLRYIQSDLMSSIEIPEIVSKVQTFFIYRKDFFINTAFANFLYLIEHKHA